MNKRLSIILLCGFLTSAAFCQRPVSFEQLYNRFAQEKNVEKVNVGGLLMFLVKPFTAKYTKGTSISSVNVMSLDDCSRDVKLQFNKLAEQLNDDNYELFLKQNEKDEKTRIFVRHHKNAIRELVIVTMGQEPALIRIKGKIRPSDIENLVNNNQ